MAGTVAELAETLLIRRRLPDPAMCRAIRVRAGASKQDVATPLGVTRQCITLWESGKRTPQGKNLLAYASVLMLLERLSAEPTNESSAGPDGPRSTQTAASPAYGESE